jgi:hypothetical protein
MNAFSFTSFYWCFSSFCLGCVVFTLQAAMLGFGMGRRFRHRNRLPPLSACRPLSPTRGERERLNRGKVVQGGIGEQTLFIPSFRRKPESRNLVSDAGGLVPAVGL